MSLIHRLVRTPLLGSVKNLGKQPLVQDIVKEDISTTTTVFSMKEGNVRKSMLAFLFIFSNISLTGRGKVDLGETMQ